MNNKRGFTISELIVVFAIVIIVSLLMMPFIKFGQSQKRKIICANNLRQQAMAMYIYAKEHDGKFPESLKTLYDESYLADKKLMDCPATKIIGTPENPEYIYYAGLSVKSPSLDILVQDKPGNHAKGGKNMLFVNGTIAWEE